MIVECSRIRGYQQLGYPEEERDNGSQGEKRETREREETKKEEGGSNVEQVPCE